MTDLQDVSDIFRIIKDALGFMKTAVGFLPKGENRDEAERQIQAAEEALRRADVRLAKDLDYKLCQCTFPPQIMLSTGRHPVHDEEIFECPRCKKQEPSEHRFQQLDRLKAHNEGRGSSWVDARHD